jgi:chemotaxis protein MotB
MAYHASGPDRQPSIGVLPMSLKTTFAASAAAMLLAACVAPVPFNDRVAKSETYQRLDAQIQPTAVSQQEQQEQLEQLQNLVRVTLADSLLFPSASAQLSESGKAALAKLAPALKDLSSQRIVVKGFSDDSPVGMPLMQRIVSNVELSKARAAAVQSFLASQGVPQDLIYISGLGESHPVASNDTEQGRAQNRRVEIDVVAAPA